MKFFSLDGPFQKYGTIVYDLLMLNLYWLLITVFSAGLLIGPASVSLYHTVNRCVRQSIGQPTKTFFSIFKSKFKWSFIGGLLTIFIIFLDTYTMYSISAGVMPSWFFIPYFASLLYLLLIIPYYTVLVGDTDFKFRKLVKYSIILSIKHLPTSLLILVIMFITYFAIYISLYLSSLFIFAPVFLMVSYFLSGRALKNYDFTEFE